MKTEIKLSRCFHSGFPPIDYLVCVCFYSQSSHICVSLCLLTSLRSHRSVSSITAYSICPSPKRVDSLVANKSRKSFLSIGGKTAHEKPSPNPRLDAPTAPATAPPHSDRKINERHTLTPCHQYGIILVNIGTDLTNKPTPQRHRTDSGVLGTLQNKYN